MNQTVKLKLLIVFFCLLIGYGETYSQQADLSNRYMLGLFAAGTLNMHKGTFGTYDGILDCGFFKDATSLGWQIGNSFDMPLIKGVGLSARFFYYDAGGNFKSPNPNPPEISLPDGSLARLQTEQSLDATLDYFQLEVLAKIPVISFFYLALGPGVGIANRAMYNQSETIQSPSGATFTNGDITRNIVSGRFEDTPGHTKNLRFVAHLAIGADILLTNRIVLNPEIGYSLPFTKVIANSDWTVSTLQAGIGVKFILGDLEKVKYTAPPEKENPPSAKPTPVLAMLAKNVLKDGTILNYSEILVTEEVSNEVMPLLPYIFFDKNSSEIPTRYNKLSPQQTSSFDEMNLRDSVIGVYHNLLNIIGQRMKNNPKAKIDITGCVEPYDDTSELQALSQARADNIKKYLVDTWNIEPDRIKTQSRQLPSVVSNRQIDDGKEENRRAEIATDDNKILAPVKIGSKNSDILPESILLEPNIQFGESVTSWDLAINDIDNKNVWASNGTGQPAQDIKWDYNKKDIVEIARQNKKKNYLDVDLNMLTENGEKINAKTQIPVRHQVFSKGFSGNLVKDSTYDRFDLIFFDFDKPTISKFNQDVMEVIQQRIRTNSSVKVTGYTDRVGAEKHNFELSKSRAETIADALLNRIVPNELANYGAGETMIYNNDLPEGRFYNRTVIIDIATPVEY